MSTHLTKKTHIFLILLFIVLLLILFTPTLTQASFADDYQGYLKTYDAYRITHIDYITKRSQYLQYQTLNSKSEALTAVKNLLLARNDVLLGHISLLRAKNVDSVFNGEMDTYFNFLADHKNKVSQLGSLEDAVKVSQEVQDQHLAMQNLSRKVVGSIILAKIETQKTKFLQLENEATLIISALKSTNKDVSTQERWLLDAQNKRFLTEQKILEAKNRINQFQSKNVTKITENYNDIQFIVLEANQYIREGVSFLNELVQSIKYGNF